MQSITKSITSPVSTSVVSGANQTYRKLVGLGHSFWARDDLAKRINKLKSGQIEIIDQGVGGNTYAQMDTRFSTAVAAFSPDLVILDPPMNDLIAGTSANDILTSYLSIKAKCDAIKATLMTSEATPCGTYATWSAPKQTELVAWNALLPTLGVVFAKTYTAMEDPSTPEKLNALFDDVPDGLHFNSAGFDVYAPLIAGMFNAGGNAPAKAARALGYRAYDNFAGLATIQAQEHPMVVDTNPTFAGWYETLDAINFTLTGSGGVQNLTVSGAPAEKLMWDSGSRDGVFKVSVKWPAAAEHNLAFQMRLDEANNNDVIYLLVQETEVFIWEFIDSTPTQRAGPLAVTYTPGDFIDIEATCSGADVTFKLNNDAGKVITYGSADATNLSGVVGLSCRYPTNEFRDFIKLA